MRKYAAFSPGCFHIVACIVIGFCIWGLAEFKMVIDENKLKKAVIGHPCLNATIELYEPYSPTSYKDCMDYSKNLPRDKFYCYQVALSNYLIVYLDECFEKIEGDITRDITVFSKPFRENPFEITLFVTVILLCVVMVIWAFTYNKNASTRLKYEKINEVSP